MDWRIKVIILHLLEFFIIALDCVILCCRTLSTLYPSNRRSMNRAKELVQETANKVTQTRKVLDEQLELFDKELRHVLSYLFLQFVHSGMVTCARRLEKYTECYTRLQRWIKTD